MAQCCRVYWAAKPRRSEALSVRLPQAFRDVPYEGACFPGAATGLEDGANCQHFAYELLRHFGFEIGNLRSSNLWADRKWTRHVKTIDPFDLLLFNRTREAWGAHVGVCLDAGRIVHLSKQIGTPVIWSLERFAEKPRYAVFLGAKRPIQRLADGTLTRRLP